MRSLARYYISRLLKGMRNRSAGIDYLRAAAMGKLRIRLEGDYVPPADGSVLDESWDVLVVLDACRYDSMRNLNPFDSSCEKRRSQGPNTAPWFVRNFLQVRPERLSDVVYVTANPKTSETLTDESRFHRFDRVFETYWDRSVGSVRPEHLTDIALKRAQEHEGKRLIVHYLQPHGPFVGSDRPDLHENNYETLQKNKVSLEEVLEAYHASLSYALSHVERLVEGVSGSVVITADHGESFGENGIYGHPPWAHSRVLLDVPWIETSGGDNDFEFETQRIKEERAVSTDIEDQLESLGYS